MIFKAGKLPTINGDRIAYLYSLQEKLKLHHNKKGEDYRNGKITEQEFRDYQKTWFNDRSLFICEEINKCKVAMQKNTKTISNLDDMMEE